MRAIAGVFALTFPIAFGLIVLGLPATHAAAADRKISDFYGAYTGQSISLKGEGLSARDLSVRIKPNKQGFNLSWTTVTHKKGSSAVRKSYSIDFSKSPRKNMWGSAVRRDAFGNMQPINPLQKGDPFVWATLKGDTLTVYALIITASGGYELQTYARTLTADGMRLNFTRLRDGERLKAITGVLVKKK
ncbi:MAG: hypothetical protein P8Z76_02245 [Alphaproteobacteria bacterium]